MKKPSNVLAVFCALIILFIGPTVNAQSTIKQKPKTTNSKFIGKWKGSEKCNDVSAPVALLFVTANGTGVLLSGLYSIQGEVQASLKGDTIVIPRQEVKDPNFSNMEIEGKLAFGINPFNLSGNLIVLNNQKKDECFVTYYK